MQTLQHMARNTDARCISLIWKSCFLLLWLTFSSVYGDDPSPIFKQIAKQDLEDIRDLFSHFIYKNHFAYTLLGGKAVSLTAVELSESQVFRNLGKKPIQFANNFLGCKWEKWKRCQSLFPIKKFLIIEETVWFNPYIRHIMLINKEQFIKVVNQNQIIFRKELGNLVTGENLFALVENQGKLRPVINNSELLFGILLGYGERNAALYDQRNHLQRLCDQYRYILIKKAYVIKELKKQIDEITEILQPCGEYCDSIFPIPSTHFVADLHSKETIALKKKYQLLREKASGVYAHGDVLEITISTLIQD